MGAVERSRRLGGGGGGGEVGGRGGGIGGGLQAVRGEAPESRFPEHELSLVLLLILLVGPTWLESPRAFVVSDYIPLSSPVFLGIFSSFLLILI